MKCRSISPKALSYINVQCIVRVGVSMWSVVKQNGKVVECIEKRKLISGLGMKS